MNNDKMLSVILGSYFSGDRARLCYEKLGKLLAEEKIPFEFIIIDDGSKDDSYDNALKLERAHDNVRAYRLSRNYGSFYAGFAGLSVCQGACVVPICDDEQQPYNTIVDMYRLWEKGHKVVIPCRRARGDSKISKLFSNAFYWIMNEFSDVPYPPGGADTFFIDREVMDIINSRIHPCNTTTISEVLRLGFDPYFYEYERPIGLNKGKSRWTFRKKVRLAMDNFFSSSTFPIKLISVMGAVAFFLSVIMGMLYTYIFLFGNKTFWGRPIPGWTSMVVLLFAFGGLILLALSMIAEYIWRIYEEVKARPGYVIRSKKGESLDGVD